MQEKLAVVASVNRPVLLIGERGTGKELAAARLHLSLQALVDAVHPLELRGLPPDLVESELFGHEPGSFTGATRRRLGRASSKPTAVLSFWMKSGQMPLPVQEKILRVVEYGAFERVGGEETIQMPMCLVAALRSKAPYSTMRRTFSCTGSGDLADFIQKVPPSQEGPAHRQPLLSVSAAGDSDRCADRCRDECRSPARLPGRGVFEEDLLDRLASHGRAHARLCASAGKTSRCSPRISPRECPLSLVERRAPEIDRAPTRTLRSHRWPGNIRELRNVIERAVVHSRDAKLGEIDLDPVSRSASRSASKRRNWETTLDRLSIPLDLSAFVENVRRRFLQRALREETLFISAARPAMLGLTYDQFRALYRKCELPKRNGPVAISGKCRWGPLVKLNLEACSVGGRVT